MRMKPISNSANDDHAGSRRRSIAPRSRADSHERRQIIARQLDKGLWTKLRFDSNNCHASQCDVRKHSIASKLHTDIRCSSASNIACERFYCDLQLSCSNDCLHARHVFWSRLFRRLLCQPIVLRHFLFRKGSVVNGDFIKLTDKTPTMIDEVVAQHQPQAGG